MYTIVIKLKEDKDKNFDNICIFGCILVFKIGIMSKNCYIEEDRPIATYKNLTRKKATKIICKIKSIKNFENIATYTIIKED